MLLFLCAVSGVGGCDVMRNINFSIYKLNNCFCDSAVTVLIHYFTLALRNIFSYRLSLYSIIITIVAYKLPQ